MPPRNHLHNRFMTALVSCAAILLPVCTLHADEVAGQDRSGSFTQVRAREIELYYHLEGADSRAEIELWYTRDRGANWLCHEHTHSAAQGSPIRFIAPAEGLYGFILIARDGTRASRPNPNPFEQAQRWVFVDYTPPLAQWLGIDPIEIPVSADQGETPRERQTVMQMRWTAYDSNMPARPISLYYRSCDDRPWKVIESQLPNVGQYLWTPPEELTGQITLKLQVLDLGGHVVERVFGPVSVDNRSSEPEDNLTMMAAAEPGETQPAHPEMPQPEQAPRISPEQSRKARDYYTRGAFHWRRGEYALAAARFREALEADPNMLEAMIDLAGVYCYLQDFDRAIRLYQSVIERDDRNRHALLGAALAYSAAKQYPESREMLLKLLESNDRDAEAWLYLGDVLFQMGGLGEARKYWRTATEVDASATRVIEEAREKLKTFVPADAAATADAKITR